MLKLLLFTSHGLSISYKLQRKTFHVLSDLYHQQTITTYYSPIYDETNFFYRFFTTIHRNKKGEKYRNKELFDRKYPITSLYKKSFEIFSRNLINAERTGFKKKASSCLEALNPINPAERTGFEPANRFCRLHAFQACLFNHSSTSPNCLRLQR